MQNPYHTNNYAPCSGKGKGFIFSTYFFLMLLFYSGYLLVDNHRLSQSELWLSKSSLTAEDVASITQVGRWASNFEVMFIVLFMAMSILCFMRNRKDSKVLKQFLVVNMFLFIGVVALGCLIYFIKPLRAYLPSTLIGNMLQPLFIPIYISGGLLIYMLWKLIKRRQAK